MDGYGEERTGDRSWIRGEFTLRSTPCSLDGQKLGRRIAGPLTARFLETVSNENEVWSWLISCCARNFHLLFIGTFILALL